jgi:hypothetical protein
MVRAFVYLTACSFRNRLRRSLARLREPRYLVGFLVGAAYLYFLVFRRVSRSAAVPDVAVPSLAAQLLEPLQVIATVGLFAAALAAWIVPGLGRSLTFSRAEVQFLFTAPVSRRGLVHFKLLRSQISILINSLIVTALLRPGSMERAWPITVGMWLVLSALRLHLMGVALARRSLAQHGRSGWVRVWLPLTMVLGAVGVVGATLAVNSASLRALPDGGAVFGALRRLFEEGAVGVVLWPFRALIRLPMAPDLATFLAHLPAALALLAANYAWVLRSDAAFEEAAAAHAERTVGQSGRQRAVSPRARGESSQPFALTARGLPELAILWKNLIQAGRFVSPQNAKRLLPFVVVLVMFAVNGAGSGGSVTRLFAALSVPLAVLAVFFGPQLVRTDLRQDLALLGVLKTWPVSGPAIVRGSVLAPTMILSFVAWFAALLALLFPQRLPALVRHAGVVDRVAYVGAAAIAAPALILVQTVLHNALAVLFPAWSAIATSRGRGIDAMGQRLLLLGGTVVAMVVLALPGLLAAGAVFLAARLAFGVALAVLPALVFTIVVAGACWVACEAIGRALARTDITAIDPGDSGG